MAASSVNEIVMGEEAKAILEHPLFANAVSMVRDGLIKGMASSAMGDEQTHNRLVIALQLLNQIEKQLKDQIATGKMAEIQVKESLAQRIFG